MLPEDVTESIPDDGIEEWLDNDRTAESALRRLRRLTHKREELRAQCDAWTNEILEWWSGEDGPMAREVERLTTALEHYALATRSRDDRKTVELPSGTLSTRQATDPIIDITDPKAVIAWLDAEDTGIPEDVVRREPKVLVSALRKHLAVHRTEDGEMFVTTAAGELVPGVEAREPETVPHVATK